MPCWPRFSSTRRGIPCASASASPWRRDGSEMPADYLRKVGEILRSGKPIEERLREFCHATGEFLPGAVSSILLFDRDTEDFYLRTTTLRVSPAAQVVHHSSTGTIEDLALRERRSITLCEVHRTTDSRLRGEMFFFPLVSADEPLGVLVIQSVSESGVAAEKTGVLGEAVLLLSDSVGVSLREETASQRMTKIAAINEAGINIISTLDLSRLLKLIATSASLIMEAESCVIRLLDSQTGKYGIREFYGMKPESDQQDLFRMDKKGVTEILRGEPSILVRETADDEKWKEFSGVARTMIMLPLTRDSEIIGTVSMFDKFPHKTFYPAGTAVDPDGVHVSVGGKLPGDGARLHPHGRLPAVVQRERREHHRAEPFGRPGRQPEFLQVGERLQDDEVDALGHQRADLLGKGLLHLDGVLVRHDLVRADARPHGAGDVHRIPRGLPGDANRLAVDLHDLLGKSVRPEGDPVGPEGVRLDRLGPGLHVFPVDLADELRVGEGEFVEAGVDEDPALVDHRPHRAVKDQRGFLHPVEDPLHRLLHLVETGLGRVAHGAHPLVRQRLEGRPGGDVPHRVARLGIVHVPAIRADVFLHGIAPSGVYTAKYFACGWCATMAEVVCSGTISIVPVSVTPISSGRISSNTGRWAERSGQAGYPKPYRDPWYSCTT